MARRILVLDDEEDILALIGDVLEEVGYEVMRVSSPEQVRPALAGVHPQLLLVDIMLKGQSGIDIARSLQTNGLADTPMIAMTASPSMAAYARESGVFVETLDKPFDITYLLDTVERYLSTHPS